MEIRHTKETDLRRVMEIYSQARAFMKSHGNPNQWGPTNWPPEQLIKDDITNKNSYVCLSDNRIVGVFYFDRGNDIEPTYRDIEGEWLGNNEYGVVHRIATDSSVRGTGTYCLNWAFEKCGNLRIDTHPDNIVMQNLLEKCGFKKCGIIYVVEDNFPRYAYEKM